MLSNRRGAFQNSPQMIFAEGSQVTDVDSSSYNACAVVDGGLQCWGYNYSGQLANGTTKDSLTPVIIFPSHSGVQQVMILDESNICATKNNELYCWGSQRNKYLGIAREVRDLLSVDGF